MRCTISHALRLITIKLILAGLVINALGQDKTGRKEAGAADDVVRINTELVQTDVTVVNKQGNLVEGLQREQFELRVDGQPVPITFFDRVIAGGSKESKQLAGTSAASATNPASIVSADTTRGRVIFFFVDDVHLSSASLERVRKSLLHFVNDVMGQNDIVAIVSSSGQVGFLQQLTDNKTVLRAAIGRLGNRQEREAYAGKVPMSEYEASQLTDVGNRELFTYLVSATVNEYQWASKFAPAPTRGAVNMVKNRANQISSQAKIAAGNTLGSLESLMLSSAPLPGRKLVVFFSDGFVTEARASNLQNRLRQVTDAAARVGAVIYAMDARGTFSDPTVDASRNDYPDMASGRVSRNIFAETSATQEPLHTLAENTGGRAILNSNSFDNSIEQAIKETAAYYLLAWRPENDKQRNRRSRIEVFVKNRSDLRVRLRQGYVEMKPPASDKKTKQNPDNARSAESELLTALGSLYARREVPIMISTGYVNMAAQGTTLIVSMQIDSEALDYASVGGAQKAEIDLIGAAIDDRGKFSSFRQRVRISPVASTGAAQKFAIINQRLSLAPGLYQVRVALRDSRSGRTGSAMQWIEIPDFAAGRFGLSSLFLGERSQENTQESGASKSPKAVTVDVDHRFARTSVLRFQTYVYNAALTSSSPDVYLSVKILRDNKPVLTMPLGKLPAEVTKDMKRIPYWAEIPINQLPPGKYILQLTATDNTTKASASQQEVFTIE
jgi:VWFA-related protein